MAFTKAPSYRTVYASGAFGGLTPNGLISMGVFSEYKDFPETTVYDVIRDMDEGKAEIKEDQSKRTGRQLWTRELQVNVLMDRSTAVALRTWIDGKIKELDNLSSRNDQQPPDDEEGEQTS